MQALNRQQLARKNRTRPAALQLDIPDDELLGSPWPATFAGAIGSLQLADAALPLQHFHSADVVIGERAAQALPDASQWDELLKLDAPWVPARSIAMICDRLAAQLR